MCSLLRENFLSAHKCLFQVFMNTHQNSIQSFTLPEILLSKRCSIQTLNNNLCFKILFVALHFFFIRYIGSVDFCKISETILIGLKPPSTTIVKILLCSNSLWNESFPLNWDNLLLQNFACRYHWILYFILHKHRNTMYKFI